MKILSLACLSAVGCLLFACANDNQAVSTGKSNDSKSHYNLYQNEYFSINYPLTYKVEAAFDYPLADMEELKTMDPDAIRSMPVNEMYIVPKAYNIDWQLPEVNIVLSCFRLDAPIRIFMDLAIYARSQENLDNLSFIGNTEVDSISFAGYPALVTDFLYKEETGDTLVDHRIIVQQPDYKIFYINTWYKASKSDSYEKGEEIISTFRFNE